MLIFLISSGVSAAELSYTNAQDVYDAAHRYNVDPQLMLNIAYIESANNVKAVRVNKNNSLDIGLFQINTVHWNSTCKEFNIFYVKGNALCAAKILSSIKKKHSKTDKLWLGRYHSKTPSKKLKYFNLLVKHSMLAHR